MRSMKARKSFTLIELIMVIVVLGILAAIAIPRYVDLSAEAEETEAKCSLGALRSAVNISIANNRGAIPSTITKDMFQDGVVPTNPLDPPSDAVVNSYDGTGGWVYYPATGTAESNDAARTTL